MAMKLSRRQFVATGATVTVGLSSCSGDATPPEVIDPATAGGVVDLQAFAWGIQVGDATDTAALLSVRTLEPRLLLQVWMEVANGWERVQHDEVHTPDNGVVQLELSGLASNTRYAHAFYSEDRTRRTVVGYWRTAPATGTRRVIRFGASCCFGGNAPWPVLTRAAQEQLDFFILLGDTVYADHGEDAFDYEGKWNAALQVTGLIDLTASTSIVALWDDHEVDNDWSWATGGIEDQVADAKAAFRRGLPQRSGPNDVMWRKLSWGETLDVFVLDLHGERRDGNIVSPEQLQWLKDELAASPAVFKVVLNSVPMTDFSETPVGALEADGRWQGYAAQRTELLSHIRNEAIEGVVWITGDVHTGGACLIDPPGQPGESQHEIIAGPGGSPISPVGFLRPSGQILNIVPMWNYVRFEADPDARTVHAVFIGDDGQELAEWGHALRPKGK